MRSINGYHLARTLGTWHRPGTKPAYVQLAEAIQALVLDGRLALETRLPSERDVASSLDVSRTTATAAYDLLRADGFAASRRGSGTWTTLPADRSAQSAAFAPTTDDTHIDLTHAAPEAPGPHLRAAYDDALARGPLQLSGHGYHVLGLPELRAAVARRYTERGLPTNADQIMITAGGLHAIALLLRLVARPGNRVVVDHPTYPNALEALRGADTRVIPVPMRPDGWDLDAFAATVRQSAPHVAYLIPDFQNPTGLSAGTAERKELAAVLARAHTFTIVDETLVELGLTGEPSEPMASHHSAVVTIGSTSKTFWGGLRIGWIRAEPSVIRKLIAVRAGVDLASPVLEQGAATYLVEHIDEILPTLRAELRRRRDTLLGLLAHHLPGWTVRVPDGGLVLWCDIGVHASTRLAVIADQHGLRLAAGPRFGVDGAFERFLRLPYTLPVDVLQRAVPLLARAYAALPRDAGSTLEVSARVFS